MISYSFIRRHSVISGLLSLLVLLYLFLPFIANLVIFWSPFVVFIAFFVRIFWTSERPQPKEGTNKELSRQIPENLGHGKDKCSSGTGRLQCTMQNDKERDGMGDALLTKSLVSEFKEAAPEHGDCGSSEPNSFTVAANKELIEDSKTGTVEIEESSSGNRKVDGAAGDCAQQRRSLNSEPSMSDLVLTNSLEDKKGKDKDEVEETEDEEAEAQDNRNKAVVWTENDQKNLMDLGVSEIERNRRLESLIARRRATQQLKSQIEKGLPDMSVREGIIAPLYITKGPTYDSHNTEEIEGLQIPGSAPCMLGSKRNPFDLPYEPHEEKPNLKEDSFNQEFLAAQQKEAILCRHESFSLGPSFAMESIHDPNDREFHPFFILNGRKSYERLGYPRARRHLEKGNHDWLINNILSNEENRMSLLGINPVHIPGKDRVVRWATNPEKIIGKGVNQNATFLESKGDEIDNPLLLTMTNGGLLVKDDIGESSPSSMAIGSERSPHFGKHDVAVKQEIEPNFSPMHRNLLVDDSSNFPSPSACLTPTYSIASDLQVEVSDIGSPPTMDGTETESMGCEADMEKESDSEDIDHMLKIEESEDIPKDSHEANDVNNGVQSAATKDFNDASVNPLHSYAQSNSTDADLISSAKPDMAVDSSACPTTSDQNGTANVENQLPSTSTDVQHEENSAQMMRREELAVNAANSSMNRANPIRPSVQGECLLEEGPVDSEASSPQALAHSSDSDQKMHNLFSKAKDMSDIQTSRGEPEGIGHPTVGSDHVQAQAQSVKHMEGEPTEDVEKIAKNSAESDDKEKSNKAADEAKSHSIDEENEAVGEDNLNPVEAFSLSEAVDSKPQPPPGDSIIPHNEDVAKDSHISDEHDNVNGKPMKNSESSEEIPSQLQNDIEGNLRSASPINDDINKDGVQEANPPSTSPQHGDTS